jgi:hypothetical protein
LRERALCNGEIKVSGKSLKEESGKIVKCAEDAAHKMPPEKWRGSLTTIATAIAL